MIESWYNRRILIRKESNIVLDWKKISTDIISNLGDQGKITQILSDLETEVTTFNTRFSDMERQTNEQASQIDSLQKTNMNLFLKIGNPVPDEKLNNTEKLTYENLFDENGGLK